MKQNYSHPLSALEHSQHMILINIQRLNPSRNWNKLGNFIYFSRNILTLLLTALENESAWFWDYFLELSFSFICNLLLISLLPPIKALLLAREKESFDLIYMQPISTNKISAFLWHTANLTCIYCTKVIAWFVKYEHISRNAWYLFSMN